MGGSYADGGDEIGVDVVIYALVGQTLGVDATGAALAKVELEVPRVIISACQCMCACV